MTSFFNYKGDAAGPTYEDYEFEVEVDDPDKDVDTVADPDKDVDTQ